MLLQQADLSKFQRDRVAHRDPAAGPLGGTGSLTPVFILNVQTTVGISVKESIGDDLYTILQNSIIKKMLMQILKRSSQGLMVSYPEDYLLIL